MSESGDEDDPISKIDFSVIAMAIEAGGTMLDQILKGIQYGTPEIRYLLFYEADFIVECKVCRNLFRSFPLFIAHKRIYCTTEFQDVVEKTNLPEQTEDIIVVEPRPTTPVELDNFVTEDKQAEKTGSGSKVATAKNAKDVISKAFSKGNGGKSKSQTLSTSSSEQLSGVSSAKNSSEENAIQEGEDDESTLKKLLTGTFKGKSSAYCFYNREAEKVEAAKSTKQVETTVTMTPITTNKNAVFMTVSEKEQDDTEQQNVQNNETETSVEKEINKDNNEKSQIAITSNQSTKSTLNKKQQQIKGQKVLNLRPVKSQLGSPSRSELSELGILGHCDLSKNKCRICNIRYGGRKSLLHHMHSKHSGDKWRFPCCLCDKEFAYFWGLTRHVTVNHNKSKLQVEKMRKKLRALAYQDHSTGATSDKKDTSKDGNVTEVQSSVSTRTSVRNEVPNETQHKIDNSAVIIKLNTCDGCGKKFWKKSSYDDHILQCKWLLPQTVLKKITTNDETHKEGKTNEKDKKTAQSREDRSRSSSRTHTRSANRSPSTDRESVTSSRVSASPSSSQSKSSPCDSIRRSRRALRAPARYARRSPSTDRESVSSSRSRASVSQDVEKGKQTSLTTLQHNTRSKGKEDIQLMKTKDKETEVTSKGKEEEIGKSSVAEKLKGAKKEGENPPLQVSKEAPGKSASSDKPKGTKSKDTKPLSQVSKDNTGKNAPVEKLAEAKTKDNIVSSQINKDAKDKEVTTAETSSPPKIMTRKLTAEEKQSEIDAQQMRTRFFEKRRESKSPQKNEKSPKSVHSVSPGEKGSSHESNSDVDRVSRIRKNIESMIEEKLSEATSFTRSSRTRYQSEKSVENTCSKPLNLLGGGYSTSALGLEKSCSPSRESSRDRSTSSQRNNNKNEMSSNRSVSESKEDKVQDMIVSPRSTVGLSCDNKKDDQTPLNSFTSVTRTRSSERHSEKGVASGSSKEKQSEQSHGNSKSSSRDSSVENKQSYVQVGHASVSTRGQEKAQKDSGKAGSTSKTSKDDKMQEDSCSQSVKITKNDKAKNMQEGKSENQAQSKASTCLQGKSDTSSTKGIAKDTNNSEKASSTQKTAPILEGNDCDKDESVTHLKKRTIMQENKNLGNSDEVDGRDCLLDNAADEDTNSEGSMQSRRRDSNASANNLKVLDELKTRLLGMSGEQQQLTPATPSADGSYLGIKINPHETKTRNEKLKSTEPSVKSKQDEKDSRNLSQEKGINAKLSKSDYMNMSRLPIEKHPASVSGVVVQPPVEYSKTRERTLEVIWCQKEPGKPMREVKTQKTVLSNEDSPVKKKRKILDVPNLSTTAKSTKDAEDKPSTSSGSGSKSGSSERTRASSRVYVVDSQKSSTKASQAKLLDLSKIDTLIDMKNFKCNQCHLCFSNLSNVRRHVVRHLGWQRYKCKLCKFSSYNKSECNTHLHRCHGNKLRGISSSQFIIDLKKEGSKVRSQKKQQTIQSRQSEGEGPSLRSLRTRKVKATSLENDKSIKGQKPLDSTESEHVKTRGSKQSTIKENEKVIKSTDKASKLKPSKESKQPKQSNQSTNVDQEDSESTPRLRTRKAPEVPAPSSSNFKGQVPVVPSSSIHAKSRSPVATTASKDHSQKPKAGEIETFSIRTRNSSTERKDKKDNSEPDTSSVPSEEFEHRLRKRKRSSSGDVMVKRQDKTDQEQEASVAKKLSEAEPAKKPHRMKRSLSMDVTNTTFTDDCNEPLSDSCDVPSVSDYENSDNETVSSPPSASKMAPNLETMMAALEEARAFVRQRGRGRRNSMPPRKLQRTNSNLAASSSNRSVISDSSGDVESMAVTESENSNNESIKVATLEQGDKESKESNIIKTRSRDGTNVSSSTKARSQKSEDVSTELKSLRSRSTQAIGTEVIDNEESVCRRGRPGLKESEDTIQSDEVVEECAVTVPRRGRSSRGTKDNDSKESDKRESVSEGGEVVNADLLENSNVKKRGKSSGSKVMHDSEKITTDEVDDLGKVSVANKRGRPPSSDKKDLNDDENISVDKELLSATMEEESDSRKPGSGKKIRNRSPGSAKKDVMESENIATGDNDKSQEKELGEECGTGKSGQPTHSAKTDAKDVDDSVNDGSSELYSEAVGETGTRKRRPQGSAKKVINDEKIVSSEENNEPQCKVMEEKLVTHKRGRQPSSAKKDADDFGSTSTAQDKNCSKSEIIKEKCASQKPSPDGAEYVTSSESKSSNTLEGSTVDDAKSSNTLEGSTVDDAKISNTLEESTVEDAKISNTLKESTVDDAKSSNTQEGSTVDAAKNSNTLEQSTVEDAKSSRASGTINDQENPNKDNTDLKSENMVGEGTVNKHGIGVEKDIISSERFDTNKNKNKLGELEKTDHEGPSEESEGAKLDSARPEIDKTLCESSEEINMKAVDNQTVEQSVNLDLTDTVKNQSENCDSSEENCEKLPKSDN